MALSHIPFDEISEAHIDELIESERAESFYIEYKRESYGGSEKDHTEFLADISSFANAAGGDLLIGIKAVDGVPKE
jgi:predicted HTH transcriptional regulator